MDDHGMIKMKKSYKRSSEILIQIANDKHLKGDLTYGELVQALGVRAFGVAILLFSLPAILPFSAIPGVSFLFSVPIMIFSIQIIGKRQSLWLPKSIRDKKISHGKIVKMIHGAAPILRALERFLKPRWDWMTSPFMEIINGIALMCVAILLMLPVPLSNFIFGAILILFGLGTVEKDGLFIFLGYVFLVLYVFFIYGLIRAALHFY